MQIYPFSTMWYLTILLSIYMIHIIKKTYKNQTLETRKNFIKQFNILVITFWIIYKTTLKFDPTYNFNLWNELPLHLCNITCILFLIASIKDNNILRGLCFYTGTIGIVFAFIMPDANFSNLPIYHFRSIGYWGYHALMLIQSISLITLDIIQPTKQDIQKILSLLALLTFNIHIINLLLRLSIYPQANYFYTFGIPGNIIMDSLLQLIPIPFLFLLPILIPLYIVCLLISTLINTLKNNEKLV